MYQAELIHEETSRQETSDPSTEAVLAELGAFYPVVTYPASVEDEAREVAAATHATSPALVWPVQPGLWP